MDKTKPFDIPKELMWKAYKLVKANRGTAGVDWVSLEEFDKDLGKNLYKLWNRMSSGTYFPPAVKGVQIPKKQPGQFRMLGVPTVGDRICQMVVKLMFEPCVEPYFHPDSYGYRPKKSALDAIGITRTRCWQYDYLVEFDIRALFDNIDHELLMKAVRKHTNIKWIILYIERWLKASMQLPDGNIKERLCGTPQGGVISPVLANLFLHYVFDMWMKRNHKDKPWARYADDAVVHCKTQEEAQNLILELKARFEECKLELHPDKTKIVSCKRDSKKDENNKFTFLGYEFRKRRCRAKGDYIFTSFTPAASPDAIKTMCKKIKESNIKTRTEVNIQEIAKRFNPVITGWVNYYGKYTRSQLYKVWRYFNTTLTNYLARKYKIRKSNKAKAIMLLKRIRANSPNLFAHWKYGMEGAFI